MVDRTEPNLAAETAYWKARLSVDPRAVPREYCWAVMTDETRAVHSAAKMDGMWVEQKVAALVCLLVVQKDKRRVVAKDI